VIRGNPQPMRAVPGRTTDVKDAEWLAALLAHGLRTVCSRLAASRPPRYGRCGS